MSQWKYPSAILLMIVTLLTACSDEDFRGSITVFNDGSGTTLDEIYVAKDCSEGWGAAKATGLNVADNTWSPPVVIDWEEQSYAILHPALDNITSSIVVDVRACFGSGTCGDETSFRLHDGELESVIIRDEGLAVTPTC